MTAHTTANSKPNPLLRGAGLALLSALAFGLATPFIQRFGQGSGAWPAAALLYAGAALASIDPWRNARGTEAPVRAAHVPRLLLVALVGAVLAPVCLTWGLQRTDAVSASLLLNFEAVFTVMLAWVVHRELIGRRVALALAFMAVGGALLVAAGARAAGFGIGAFAVVLATFGWALDNTLARPLAELSPTQVVQWKGALGATLSFGLAFASGQRFPKAAPLFGLLLCGATGYGLSLRFYLRAQRQIGAARTGSIFAVAPFIGAAAAWLMGHGSVNAWSAGAALCFAVGVYLHLTESHAHAHTHEPMTHEHAHRHDDGHHDHEHHPPVRGEHSHAHSHDARRHEHPHAPDVHHRHEHEHEPEQGEEHGHGHGHGHVLSEVDTAIKVDRSG
jgi:drug/metabolite transporter (DMT)-like permease